MAFYQRGVFVAACFAGGCSVRCSQLVTIVMRGMPNGAFLLKDSDCSLINSSGVQLNCAYVRFGMQISNFDSGNKL